MPVNSIKSDGNRGSWIAPDMCVVRGILHGRWLRTVTCDPTLTGTTQSTQSIRSISAHLATMTATACTGEQQSALGLASLLLALLFSSNLSILPPSFLSLPSSSFRSRLVRQIIHDSSHGSPSPGSTCRPRRLRVVQKCPQVRACVCTSAFPRLTS